MKIRDALYDHFLGSEAGDVSTSVLYGKTIDTLPDNCTILDIGFGNATCALNNLEKLKSKGIRVDGVDIDEDYINSAKNKISNLKAEKWITATKMDMLDISDELKWDFVLFSESYPVIPRELMSEFMHKAKKLTNRDDGILFMHNLCDHPTWIGDWCKRHSPYLLGVDFGRYTSEKEFEEHLKECGLEITEKKVLFQLLMKNYPQEYATKSHYKFLGRIFGLNNDQAWRNNNQWFIRVRKKS